jgi:hypothetical protein
MRPYRRPGRFWWGGLGCLLPLLTLMTCLLLSALARLV